VAATRAKEVLHLVADLSLSSQVFEVAEPRQGSLLKRLWSSWDHTSIPTIERRPDHDSKTMPFYQAGPFVRRTEVAPAVEAAPVAPGFNAAYVWPSVKTHERVLGTLTHAWLDHIGHEGVAQWSEVKLLEQRKRIERQCIQAGVPAPELAAAVQEVIETLVAMLTHDRGQWLLSQLGAYREWALLDESGKVSVLDLVVQDERGWLVVDYKTGRPLKAETPASFGQRMLSRYAKQLQGYCEQVGALDGRAVRAALYFPRDDLWFDFEPLAMGKPC
jgi:ATP-dependent exoDNAse (exonuclease V) beta subunit